MKHKVSITETLNRVVEVEADTVEDAIDKVEKMYYNEEIVLDADDYVDVEFEEEKDDAGDAELPGDTK